MCKKNETRIVVTVKCKEKFINHVNNQMPVFGEHVERVTQYTHIRTLKQTNANAHKMEEQLKVVIGGKYINLNKITKI